MPPDEKKPSSPSGPSQQDSSSDLSSLERLLGGLTRALDGLTKAVEESQRLQASHAGTQVAHSQSVDRRLVEVAVVQRQILERLITLSGSSAKAVKALDDSRKFLVEKETKDEITGEHIRLRWTTLVKWWPVIWKAGTVALLAVGAIKYVILEAIKYWRR